MKPENSILDVEVSCFKNYNSTKPKPVNMIAWLTSDKYRREVEAIRSLPTKAERDAIKSKLPAITPSGLFSYRSKGNLVQHSGLICVDIDLKGNEAVGNYEQLRELLSKVPFIAYAGLSVSGTGFFALVPVPVPESIAEHEAHFQALKNDFASAGLIIDGTPDVTRLRGYSFDQDGYFNHYAEPYTRKAFDKPKAPKPDTIQRPARKYSTTSTGNADEDKSTVDDFNDKADTLEMLNDAGYEILTNYRRYDTERVFFKRSEATSENSGNYHIATKSLYVWSENTPDNFDVNKPYSPFMVFAQLYHNGDTKKAFADLFEKGYGGKRFRERHEYNKQKNAPSPQPAPTPDPNPYPHGVNEYTGEIFNDRGYPADWDDIAPPGEGSAEYREMLLLIQREFDAVIDTSFNPDEAQPEPLPVDTWRKRTG